MNSYNIKKIHDACPNLFSNKDPRQPINAYSFECQDGWFNLLFEALTQIEAIVCTMNMRARQDYRVVQIKEKFGTLRLYMDGSLHEDIQAIIRTAENKSSQTCERCGAPGTRRGKGWIVTQCDNCEEELAEARKGKG